MSVGGQLGLTGSSSSLRDLLLNLLLSTVMFWGMALEKWLMRRSGERS